MYLTDFFGRGVINKHEVTDTPYYATNQLKLCLTF